MSEDVKAINSPNAGSLESRKRHIGRGKVLPRERIEYLLDDKDNALEIGQLAGYDLNNNETPSGSMVSVIGKVSGRDKNGLGIGVFNGITAEQKATAESTVEGLNHNIIYHTISKGAFLFSRPYVSTKYVPYSRQYNWLVFFQPLLVKLIIL